MWSFYGDRVKRLLPCGLCNGGVVVPGGTPTLCACCQVLLVTALVLDQKPLNKPQPRWSIDVSGHVMLPAGPDTNPQSLLTAWGQARVPWRGSHFDRNLGPAILQLSTHPRKIVPLLNVISICLKSQPRCLFTPVVSRLTVLQLPYLELGLLHDSTRGQELDLSNQMCSSFVHTMNERSLDSFL